MPKLCIPGPPKPKLKGQIGGPGGGARLGLGVVGIFEGVVVNVKEGFLVSLPFESGLLSM